MSRKTGVRAMKRQDGVREGQKPRLIRIRKSDDILDLMKGTIMIMLDMNARRQADGDSMHSRMHNRWNLDGRAMRCNGLR